MESYFNYCNSGGMNQEVVDGDADWLYWKSDKMSGKLDLNPIPDSQAPSFFRRNLSRNAT